MRVRDFLFWAVAFVQTVPLPAQAPSPSGDAAFRADAQVVLVDAAVTDKKGNIPRDLTAQDFKILEDGKEQKITSVSFTGSAAPGRNGRHFLALVFEIDQPAFRQEAMRFVDQFAGPDLYLAIYVRVNRQIHLSLPFTTDPARIKAALTNMQIQIVGTDPLFYNDKNLVPHSVVMENVSSVAAELAGVHGRKALVLFAPGFYSIENSSFRTLPDGTTVRPFPSVNSLIERAILQAIDDCNQANVAVYSFTLSTTPTGSPEDWYHPEDAPENSTLSPRISARTSLSEETLSFRS